MISVISLLLGSVILAALAARYPLGPFAMFFSALAAAMTAFVCDITEKKFLFLTGITAYLIALLFTRSPAGALAGIAYWPAAAALYCAVKKRSTKTFSVLLCAGGLAAAAALYLAALLWEAGSLNPTGIHDLVNAATGILYQSFIGIGADEETAGALLRNLLLLSPAFIVTVLNLMAYISCSFAVLLYRIFGHPERLPEIPWRICMSTVSAYVFAIVYVICILFSGTGDITVIGITTENILLMLTPGFALTGLRSISARIRRRSSGFLNVVIVILSLLLFFLNIYAFLTILSFYGVIDTIIASFRGHDDSNPKEDGPKTF